MNRSKKIFAAVALVCGLCMGGAGIAGAAQNDAPRGGYQQPYQQLTPEQYAEAQKILNENYADTATARQELSAKMAQLDQQLASPNPDRGTIERLSREIGDLRGKMLSSRIDARNRLAERNLPVDYYAPCWGGWQPQNYGPYGYWGHHGGRGGHGPRGGWGCPGMMMWR